MDLGLQGRVYVVTGASRGLGFATAQTLVDEGARVVLGSRDAQRVEAAAARLGPGAVGITADLADPTSAQRLIDTALERWGRVDGAVLSVGGPPPTSVTDATDDQWRMAFESVFLGQLRVARALVKLTRPAEHGELAVTFVLSTSVRAPVGPLGISNGLRPGLAMVVKSLADEHAHRGVRVNAVLPGRVDTDRIKEIEAASGNAEQARAESLRNIPMGRLGEPREFAAVAAFLTSPAASYLTGVAIPVDGGATRFI